MAKKIVCRCHDVTEDDIISAIRNGYDDLESLKRLTGITTGHCQGKTCMRLVMDLIYQETGKVVQKTTRIRAPVVPVPLGSLVEE